MAGGRTSNTATARPFRGRQSPGRGDQSRVMPPSATRSMPVTKLESLDARRIGVSISPGIQSVAADAAILELGGPGPRKRADRGPGRGIRSEARNAQIVCVRGQPTPTPRCTRPPDSASREATRLASTSGLHCGRTTISAPRRLRRAGRRSRWSDSTIRWRGLPPPVRRRQRRRTGVRRFPKGRAAVGPPWSQAPRWPGPP